MASLDKIKAAQDRIGDQAVRTPLLSSPFLDDIAGRKVFVKAECLQRTGSFKFRGGWSAISHLAAQGGSKGVMAFSSGNHGQGVAIAAAKHGFPCVIVMPADSPKIKMENIRALGAEVITYDRATQDRMDIANAANESRGLTFIHPYDNEYVIAGQGTVGLELLDQTAQHNITSAEILVCCGGGGLSSGISLAMESNPNFLVRTCEPAGFDDVARSLASGKIEANPSMVGTICDAIATRQPGDLTFPILSRLCGSGLVVTDDECLHAMALAFQRLKIVIEPGGAVGLAAALFHPNEIDSPTAIAVASGGNVDSAIFQMALEKYGT